jgi:hypothetical protein
VELCRRFVNTSQYMPFLRTRSLPRGRYTDSELSITNTNSVYAARTVLSNYLEGLVLYYTEARLFSTYSNFSAPRIPTYPILNSPSCPLAAIHSNITIYIYKRPRLEAAQSPFSSRRHDPICTIRAYLSLARWLGSVLVLECRQLDSRLNAP